MVPKYKFGYENINLTEKDPLVMYHNTDTSILVTLISAKVPWIRPVPQNVEPRLAHMTQFVTTDIYSGSTYMVGYFPSSWIYRFNPSNTDPLPFNSTPAEKS